MVTYRNTIIDASGNDTTARSDLVAQRIDTNKRRSELKNFARNELIGPNRCQAIVNIVNKAAEQVEGLKNPSRLMIDDLEKVLIGSDMLSSRGKGVYFVGNPRGAKGFKKNLRDTYNQIQHAMAGVVIGYRYGYIGQRFAMWVEEEPQDDELYKATCPLGRNLNDSNYNGLAERLRTAIGDQSCQVPEK